MIEFLTYDLVGIVGVMLASLISIGFVLFDEYTEERNMLFMVMIPLILSNFVVLIHSKCRPVHMHNYKVFVISGTQIMGFLTAIIGRIYLSNEYQVAEIYPRLERGIISVIIGFLFWLSKYPERIPLLG